MRKLRSTLFSSDTGGDADRYKACNVGDTPATLVAMGLPDSSDPFVRQFIYEHPAAAEYFPADD